MNKELNKVILNIKDLTLYLNNKNILNNINLVIKENEIIGITGPSGSGKTTLINTLINKFPYEGSISFLGKDLKEFLNIEKQNELNLKIAIVDKYLFDDLNLFLTVRTIIQNFMYLKNIQDILTTNQIIKMFNLFNMHYFLDKKINHLSFNERQNIKLLLCLCFKPKILCIDEGFSFLSNKNKKEFFNSLFLYKKTYPLTIIIISHNFINLTFCNRVFYLSDTKLEKISLSNFWNTKIDFLNIIFCFIALKILFFIFIGSKVVNITFFLKNILWNLR